MRAARFAPGPEQVHDGPLRVHSLGLVAVFAFLAGILSAPPSAGMPPGRAWAKAETLKINGHAYMAPDRFEPLRNGRLQLVAGGLYGPRGDSEYGLDWRDSTWVEAWNSIHNGYAIWPTMTSPSHQMLVWKTTKPIVDVYYNQLVTADVVNDQVTSPDTISKIETVALAYTGTSWGGRKWVNVLDLDRTVPGGPWRQRFFRSDAWGSWQEIGHNSLGSIAGLGFTSMVATGPDSVLVVVSQFGRGIRWGWLSDTTLVEMGQLSGSVVFESVPMLRRRPSGGYWLLWGEADSMLFARCFRGGAWTDPETLRVIQPGGIKHFLYDSVPSQDDDEYPAVMTEGYGISGGNPDHIFVSFPTDSGFGLLERVEPTRGSRIQTMGMDENGDVWLAWWVILDGLFWTHSYTTSTPSIPVVSERDGRPWLTWRLSESSPRTWWGVMRSVSGAPFQRVARVRAGTGLEMSWADSSAAEGQPIRYAIRRECRDVRYQVTGESADWEPRRPVLELAVRGPNPAGDRIEFEVVGAGLGALDVRLYDLQGRVVVSHRVLTSGSGRDTVALMLDGRAPSGLYFLTIASRDGSRSPHRKIVVVR